MVRCWQFFIEKGVMSEAFVSSISTTTWIEVRKFLLKINSLLGFKNRLVSFVLVFHRGFPSRDELCRSRLYRLPVCSASIARTFDSIAPVPTGLPAVPLDIFILLSNYILWSPWPCFYTLPWLCDRSFPLPNTAKTASRSITGINRIQEDCT